MDFNKPSSTITAATLTGAVVSLGWELIDTFTTFSISAGLIGSSVFVAGAVAGYLKKENVLPIK